MNSAQPHSSLSPSGVPQLAFLDRLESFSIGRSRAQLCLLTRGPVLQLPTTLQPTQLHPEVPQYPASPTWDMLPRSLLPQPRLCSRCLRSESSSFSPPNFFSTTASLVPQPLSSIHTEPSPHLPLASLPVPSPRWTVSPTSSLLSPP